MLRLFQYLTVIVCFVNFKFSGKYNEMAYQHRQIQSERHLN